ncbi:MAG: HAMP domain-containing protein [Holosporales bacterium]|nr:HAMP domain-containing protein [Holosporales bacterium]
MTYALHRRQFLSIGEHQWSVLIYLDAILLLLAAFIVAQRLARLWSEKRTGLAGSNLQTKLILGFSILAILPCLIMIIFAAAFFHGELENWFSERNKAALSASKQVAELYLKEHQKNIIEDANTVAYLISNQLPAIADSESARNDFVAQLATIKSLADIVVFDQDMAVVARSPFSFAAEFAPVKHQDLIEAWQQGVVLVGGSEYQFARALTSIEVIGNTFFVLIGRQLDNSAIEYMEKAKKATHEYENLQNKRSHLELGFIAIFLAVSLLLILAAISAALTVSWQLIKPIGRLINVAEKIRSGDMNARVPENNAKSELGLLGRSFNQMVSELTFQKNQLHDANKFIENVLSNISSGIISLNNSKKVLLINRAACNLLNINVSKCLGKPIYKLFPEAKDILDRNNSNTYEGELQVKRGPDVRVFYARVTKDVDGYIVSIDDLTELFVAQKMATWSDVARRVAHEIKNPLTPIQLAAERLKRKYLGQINNDQETFSNLIKTIVGQVGDIKRLINEFSQFAKMPSPVFTKFNFVEIFNDALLLQQVANPGIAFVNACKYDTLIIKGDARMLHQAISNVVLNAVNAIGEMPEKPQQPRIAANVLDKSDGIQVVVEDNGQGFPEEHLDRLTDPYVTMSAKGTGLGLAIVKKILSDHNGKLFLENAPNGGARVSMLIPKSP